MLKVTTIIGAYILALPLMCNLLPVLPEFEDYGWGDFDDGPENFTNSSDSKDLYVIRTIVYEIGILTDAGNDTNSTETHEEVNLKFYDPEHNGSRIVLDDIPIPIQTNVSGTSITGIAPFDFGDLELEEGVPPKLNGTVLPNAVVTVSRNVTTTTGQAGAALLRKLGPFLEQQ